MNNNIISTIIQPDSQQRQGLYLGNIQSLKHLSDIGAVVSLVNRMPFDLGPKIQHLFVQISDLSTQEIDFQKCFQFIDAQRKNTNVLVHCAAGISRSATVVIGYLMYHYGFSLQKAYSKVQELRPQVKPNPGFLAQLQKLEQRLIKVRNQKKNEEELRKRSYTPQQIIHQKQRGQMQQESQNSRFVRQYQQQQQQQYYQPVMMQHSPPIGQYQFVAPQVQMHPFPQNSIYYQRRF